MRQSHLIGRIKGLRPSQYRRLDAITHRRHPEKEVADCQTLDLLAAEVIEIKQSLHMFLDRKGLCRLLFVGCLDNSEQILDYFSFFPRGSRKDWRLITCALTWDSNDLYIDSSESIVAFDLSPVSWLRFSPHKNSSGERLAALWQPDYYEIKGWKRIHLNELQSLCVSSSSKLLINTIKKVDASVIRGSEERVLILILIEKNNKMINRYLAELEALVRSAGAIPVAVVTQKKDVTSSQSIWGKGKLKEVAIELRKNNASLVITDRELTPSQVRTLEDLLDCPLMDRSELILDIFAQRAMSASGRMEVELAQLRYRLPRLKGRGRSLSRQAGGIGSRGPGETQLEKDRRAIVSRMERLKKDLSSLNQHRKIVRKSRKNVPKVALVGYTNVGKSSLLNALCMLTSTAKVIEEDKLFATLDTVTRRLIFPREGKSPDQLLITDTVGFIRDLPATLTEAFRATFEETLDADLILLVVDLSCPDWKLHLDTVNRLLDSIGVNVKRKVVANQIDLCESKFIQLIRDEDPDVLYTSAITGAGLQSLRGWLHNFFWGEEELETNLISAINKPHE